MWSRVCQCVEVRAQKPGGHGAYGIARVAIVRVDMAPCGIGNYRGVEGSDWMAEGVNGEVGKMR